MWAPYTKLAEDGKAQNNRGSWFDGRRCDACWEHFLQNEAWFKVMGPHYCKVYEDNDFHQHCFHPALTTGKLTKCNECQKVIGSKDWFFRIARENHDFEFCETCLGPNGVGGPVQLQQQLVMAHNYYYQTSANCFLNVFPINDRALLPDFRDDITAARNVTFMSLLDDVVYHEYPTTQSLLELVMVTNLEQGYSTAQTPIETALLVSTRSVPQPVYPVYSLIKLPQDRVMINRLFATFQAYMDAREIWQFGLQRTEPFSCYIRKHQKLLTDFKL